MLRDDPDATGTFRPKRFKPGNPGVWGTAGKKPTVGKKPPVKGGSNPAPAAAAAAAKAAAVASSTPSPVEMLAQYNLARAKILQGMAPQVSGIYGDAAQRLQGIVQPVSEDLQKSLQGYGDSQQLDEKFIGASMGLQDLGKSVYGGIAPGSKEAAYYLGAALPGESLTKQGAAFGAAAAFAPERALQQGQYAVQGAVADAAEAAAKAAQGQKASPSLSKQMGYLVDVYGKPILGPNGKPIKLPEEQLTPYQRAQIGLAKGRLGISAANLKLAAARVDLSRYNSDRNYALQVDKANAQNERYYAGLELRTKEARIRLKKMQIDSRRIDSDASKTAGYIILKDGTIPRQKNGQPFAVAKKTATPKTATPLSVKDRAALQGKAMTGMRIAKNGGVDDEDKPIPPVSYTEAIELAMEAGVPEAMAVKAANRVYPKGTQGRPAMDSAEIRRALKRKWPKAVIERALMYPIIAKLVSRRAPTPATIKWAMTVSGIPDINVGVPETETE